MKKKWTLPRISGSSGSSGSARDSELVYKDELDEMVHGVDFGISGRKKTLHDGHGADLGRAHLEQLNQAILSSGRELLGVPREATDGIQGAAGGLLDVELGLATQLAFLGHHEPVAECSGQLGRVEFGPVSEGDERLSVRD